LNALGDRKIDGQLSEAMGELAKTLFFSHGILSLSLSLGMNCYRIVDVLKCPHIVIFSCANETIRGSFGMLLGASKPFLES
jgi:hypothetical protein